MASKKKLLPVHPGETLQEIMKEAGMSLMRLLSPSGSQETGSPSS